MPSISQESNEGVTGLLAAKLLSTFNHHSKILSLLQKKMADGNSELESRVSRVQGIWNHIENIGKHAFDKRSKMKCIPQCSFHFFL